jgi:ORF6N domain
MTNPRSSAGKSLVRSRGLAQKIYELRGERVMIDVDLATLYGVTTKALNQPFVAIAAGSRRTSCFSSRQKKLRV